MHFICISLYNQNGGCDRMLWKLHLFITFLISQPILIKFALKLFVCKCLSFQTHLLLDLRFSLCIFRDTWSKLLMRRKPQTHILMPFNNFCCFYDKSAISMYRTHACTRACVCVFERSVIVFFYFSCYMKYGIEHSWFCMIDLLNSLR